MKTKYYSEIDNKVIVIEVSQEVRDCLDETRKYENANNKFERRHAPMSLEAALYEGKNYGRNDTYFYEREENEKNLRERKKRFARAWNSFTDTQKRRVTLYANSNTYAEIAEMEGVNTKTVYESIEAARKKLIKIYGYTPKKSRF